jgi:hypothetical protein
MLQRITQIQQRDRVTMTRQQQMAMANAIDAPLVMDIESHVVVPVLGAMPWRTLACSRAL